MKSFEHYIHLYPDKQVASMDRLWPGHKHVPFSSSGVVCRRKVEHGSGIVFMKLRHGRSHLKGRVEVKSLHKYMIHM